MKLISKITRKEREKISHRQDILRVAEKIFAKKGFYKTTIEEIAQEAEFAVGTVYKFFKSKEKLYSAVIEEKIEKIFNSVKEEIKREPDVIKKLEKQVKLHLQFFVDNQDFFKIYVSERSSFKWDLKGELGDKVMKYYIEGINFTASIIRKGIQQRKIKPYNPKKMALAIDGLIHSAVLYWLFIDDKKSLLDEVPFIMDLIVNGIGCSEKFKNEK